MPLKTIQLAQILTKVLLALLRILKQLLTRACPSGKKCAGTEMLGNYNSVCYNIDRNIIILPSFKMMLLYFAVATMCPAGQTGKYRDMKIYCCSAAAIFLVWLGQT